MAHRSIKERFFKIFNSNVLEDIKHKISEDDFKGVEKLIRKDPTIINKPIHEYGTTPLMFASQVGADRRIIEILIKEGGEVGRKDNDHWTALHYAANWNHLHAVEILLSRGSEVNPRDDYGRTPLHRACYWGYLHTVDLLLGHNGIDANVVDNDGDTPLHKAVRRRKYKWWCVRC
ncbi:putative ankyrin repeat protein RF_0381 isoform X2 [Octopus sinensis]|uniref:Ankyrin repeat protein RF_0381 isoform X2 n=1 Tax=Octopus sinensis TaxID=2607531 RepID=A0A7E6ELE3_9MOLL|nr:putative ankyrin repeat protein RF_0381 isoform X2 [Octopus sinensis]XP_036356178.1 putative ankyrin repeat protein RF_0381 isoform X2 [Octopus sinensis]